MKNDSNRRVRQWWPVAASAVALVAGITGCGDGDRPSKQPTAAQPPAKVKAEYAIKAKLKIGDVEGELEFLPADLGIKLGGTASVKSALGDAAAIIDKDTSDNLPGEWSDVVEYRDGQAPGVYLLMAAVESCMTEALDVLDAMVLPTVTYPYVQDNPWYLFQGDSSLTCDIYEFEQEAVLCAADRLAQLADIVGPVAWEMKSVSASGEVVDGVIEFYPQQQMDVFVARDIALNALGHYVLAETQPPPGGGLGERTCLEVYIDVADGTETSLPGGLEDTAYREYFSVDDLGLGTPSEVAEWGRRRVARKITTLSAAAGLLRDLAEKQVGADLAEAIRKRAAAAEPARGIRLMWGAELPDAQLFGGNQGYGTLRHAMRTMIGRLELDWDPSRGLASQEQVWSPERPVFDPACWDDVKGRDLIFATGRDADAPYQLRPPASVGESRALAAVSEAGIVVPTRADQLDPDHLDVVRDQLAMSAVAGSGITSGPIYDAARAAGDEFSDGELQFALDQVWQAFRIFMGVDDGIRSATWEQIAASCGLRLVDPAYVVSDLDGMVVYGGFPGSVNETSPWTRYSNAFVHTACGLGYDANAQDLDHDYRFAMQGVVPAGHAIARTLARHAERLGNVPGLEETATLARAALAETKTWAGDLALFYRTDGEDYGDVTIRVAGLSEGLHPTLTDAEFASSLVLVNGRELADCIAGMRQVCPPNEEVYIAYPTNIEVNADLPECVNPGHSCVSLEFSGEDPSGYFLVLRADATAGRPGVNFGRINRFGDGTPETRVQIFSQWQKDLVDSTLQLRQRERVSPFCAEWDLSMDLENYCINGVRRDEYIPLANDLTAADMQKPDDSWRYYLDRAEDAAEQADLLGQQLIAHGLEQEVRKEAAQEEVASLCGTFPNTNEVIVDPDGTIRPQGDAELAACLDETTWDVVFLTEDRFQIEGMDGAAIRAERCSADPEVRNPPFCQGSGEVTHASLGLAVFQGESVSSTECAGFLDSYESDSSANKRALLASLGTRVYAQKNGLRAGIDAFLLDRPYVDGAWYLSVYGDPIMASYAVPGVDPAELYPYCRTLAPNGTGCTERALQWRSFFEDYSVDPTSGYVVDYLKSGDLLEATLWEMGKLAGELPAGKIWKFIPVVFLSPGGAGWFAHPVFQYSPHGLAPVPGAGYSVMDTGPGVDGSASLAMGPVLAVPPTYLTGLQNSETSLVADIWRVFTDPVNAAAFAGIDGLYDVLRTGNGYVKFNPEFESGGADYSRDALPQWYIAASQNHLDGYVTPMEGRQPGGYGDMGDLELQGICPVGGDFAFREEGDIETLGWAPVRYTLENFEAVGDVRCQPGCYDEGNLGGCGPTSVSSNCLNTDYLGVHVCPPWHRMPLFINREYDGRVSGLNRPFVNAIALSCAAANHQTLLRDDEPPPPIQELADLERLEIWLTRVADAVDATLANLVLYDVPQIVVADFHAGTVGTGATANGEHGKSLIRLGQALEEIHSGWVGLASAFRKLSGAIESTRLSLQSGSLEVQEERMQLARERLQIHREMALLSVQDSAALLEFGSSLVGSIASRNPLGVLAAGAEGTLAWETSRINHNYLERLEELAGAGDAVLEAQAATDVSRTLAELGLQSVDIYQALQGALATVRSATGTAMLSVVELRQNEDEARLAVARAIGAHHVQLESGNVPMTVNRVLSRLYSADRVRYERALESARRAAYIARLAVEQRLGVRLNTLDTSMVGVKAPPAAWADDVCSLTGIDFDALANWGDGPMSAGPWRMGYADEYVGDYVNKLREFVDHYNIQYPFQEGRDVAVVSLRDDVRNVGGSCLAETKNMLYYSDELSALASVDSEGAARGGWALTECGDACLRVSAHLPDEDGEDVLVELPGNVGAVTWLTNEMPVEAGGQDRRVPTTVYQSVELTAGVPYVLSWWDLAVLRAGGSAPGSGEGAYVVGIYDQDWRAVAVTIVEVDVLGTWSERHGLSLTPALSGTYHVAIGADGLGDWLALGIANTQLEGSSILSGPTGYSSTTGTRMELSGDCGSVDPSSWRGMFTRHCEDGECFYELNKPLVLDSEAIAKGLTPLADRFAPGNLNYRNGPISVNVVGTGVLDCSADSRLSCYGTGYVEFDLEHSASIAKILNAAGSPQCFDFKRGAIRGGKALATERMITNPVSSADQALLAQDAFQKTELSGRPLSGVYTLRIKDSPALRWERVEDIQLVFNYTYWSEVRGMSN